MAEPGPKPTEGNGSTEAAVAVEETRLEAPEEIPKKAAEAEAAGEDKTLGLPRNMEEELAGPFSRLEPLAAPLLAEPQAAAMAYQGFP